MASARWLRYPGVWLLALLLVLTALRAWFAGAVELCPDEAYYFAWSLRPDFGYFDHGPLVAWLVRVGTWLAGVNELGVRLGALLCSLVTAACLWAIARQLAGGRAACWTVLLVAVAPLFSSGAVIHTPDAGLCAAWAGAALFALHALRRDSLWQWAGCGACIGLALLAKLTALAFVAGMALFLSTCPAGRQLAWRPGPALALLVAGIVASAHIVWNATHGGGSFSFQMAHALAGGGGLLQALSFLGGQAGVVSPLLFLALVVFLIAGWRAYLRNGRSDVYLMWCLGTPLLLTCFALSFFSKVEANWPAAAYLTLAAGSAWVWSGGLFYPRKLKQWVWATGALALAMTAAAHSQALWAWMPLSPQHDPTRRLRGWRELAEVASALAGETELAAQGYALVSELRFYLKRPVYYLPAPGRLSQYDRWGEDGIPLPALVLDAGSRDDPPPCERAKLLAVAAGGKSSRSRLGDYRWWRCEPGPSGAGEQK